jgi:predicted amidohydrolase YtcJ
MVRLCRAAKDAGWSILVHCQGDAALRAITVNAARQIGLADAIGTLEPGKEADLTILESDPCTADPENIGSIAVSETWVAGEKKFG